VIRKKLAIVIYKNNRRNHCVTSIVAFWYWKKWKNYVKVNLKNDITKFKKRKILIYTMKWETKISEIAETWKENFGKTLTSLKTRASLFEIRYFGFWISFRTWVFFTASLKTQIIKNKIWKLCRYIIIFIFYV
jgi:hypothetical protein